MESVAMASVGGADGGRAGHCDRPHSAPGSLVVSPQLVVQAASSQGASLSFSSGGAAEPWMVFVGSGGGAHGTRCHAAIAVGVAPQRVLLLDTAGGFEVVAGLKRAEIDLLAVTRIFLSHRHSDHLLGLEPLLLHIGLDAMWSHRRVGEVRVYGEAAVATEKGVLQGQYSGQEGSGAYRVTTVWARSKGSWQMVAVQMTRVEEK